MLALLCLIATTTFAANKAIFQLKDARDDDHGDGTLILPTTSELRFGSLDMISLSATPEDGGTMFIVEFARPIARPDTRAIDAGGQMLESVARYGFYTFNIDIYIDRDRKSGSGFTGTLAGRNATIDPDFAWEKMICLTPLPAEAKGLLKKQIVKNLEEKLEAEKGRVDPEDASKISGQASTDIEGSYFFPERVRVNGRVISFFVPAYFLGGTAEAGWGYVVLETVANLENRISIGNFGGAQTGDLFMNLPIAEGSWSDRLGTTRKEAKYLPPIIDMFVPEGKKQEDVLRNFNVNTKQGVVLPGIVPAP